MQNAKHSIIFVLVVLACAACLFSDDYGHAQPFASKTSNPLRIGVYDPSPMNAVPYGKDGIVGSLQFEYVSVFWRDDSPSSAIYFSDGELTRLTLNAGYGFSDSLDFGIELPFYSWQAGFLDRLLTDYHKFLGVPNAGREEHPFDEFHNELRDSAGREAWGGEGRGFKGGDISAWLRYRLLHDEEVFPNASFDLALRGGLKIPTGAESGGFTSGNVDLQAGVLASFRSHRIGLDANADLILPSGFDFNTESGFDVLPFGKFMLSLQLALATNLYGIAQVAFYTPSFSSEINGLENVDGLSMLGTFGGAFKFDQYELQIGVTEDLNQQGEVDFSVIFALSAHW